MALMELYSDEWRNAGFQPDEITNAVWSIAEMVL